MRFLEFVFVLAPDLHDPAHVHFVKCGEHGCAVLCLNQSAGNGLAQLAHLFLLLIPAEQFCCNIFARMTKSRAIHPVSIFVR